MEPEKESLPSKMQFVAGTRKKSYLWLWVGLTVVLIVAAAAVILWLTAPLWFDQVLSLVQGSEGAFLSLDVHVCDSKGQVLPGSSVGVPSSKQWFRSDSSGVVTIKLAGSGIEIVVFKEQYVPVQVTITDAIIARGHPIAVELEAVSGSTETAMVVKGPDPDSHPDNDSNSSIKTDPGSKKHDKQPVKQPAEKGLSPREQVEKFHDDYVSAYNQRDLEKYMACYSNQAFGERRWQELKTRFDREFKVAGEVKMVVEKRTIGAKEKAARIDWIYHFEGKTVAGGLITADISRAKRSDFMRCENGKWRIIKSDER